MKKFIFGLMLLVSMLGIVGCSMDSSNSDGSAPVDETEYTLINKTGVTLRIAYVTKTDSATNRIGNPKEVADGKSYTVKKRDVYTYTDDKGTIACFYITSNLTKVLNVTDAKAISVEALAEPFEIPQDEYWLK